MGLAGASWERGEFSKGVEVLRTVVHLYPNFAEAHSDLGQALVRQHQFAEAIREFSIALQLTIRMAYRRRTRIWAMS